MSHRGNEGYMDFEYQNKTGPLDARSPFAQISQNAQRNHMMNTPGTRRLFDSPQKQMPSHQSSPNKPLPPRPAAFDATWMTPRKSNNDINDSSGGETPKSPEQTDNDNTPDTMGRTSRRDSWLVRFKKTFNSPGRGEIPRGDYTHAKEMRVKKPRDLARQRSKRRRHSVSESEEDTRLTSRRSPRKASSQNKHDAQAPVEEKPSRISSLFTFIASHPTVPHILSYYAQLAFNVFLLAGCAYVIYCFWAAVQGDVDKKSHEAMIDIMAEMAVCAKNYRDNNCDPDKRVPALDTVCENWNKCMNQDPSKVGRARVSAHTFAEIFNSFVEPISWKAMIFTALIVFGCFATTNMAFGFFRDKAAQHHYPPPNYYQQPPPPTPQRGFNGEQSYYGTPWQPMHGLEPAPSQGYGQIEGRGSPVKRIDFRG
ncbi:hypothetical protein DOTSEDRAFT_176120 [Dothistroma septosporum NZE10]|uniref:Brl1/Brr6 domain-containing protein n=1 Tax=Dothistroma septosporum (strain NZE10 / CBS 128990) TaxID=675120 RepID=N1PEU3_DOTSN|nr:hypothetical protein DOTSEDRAFT_176120 [Dothistroma septosporum NZE10]